MRKAALYVFLILSVFFPHNTSVSAQVPSSGEEIFIQRNCSRCHTLGRGRFVGPDLLGVGEKYSRDDLIKWAQDPENIYEQRNKKPVNEGYPPMPPMNLSESEAREVADYLLDYAPPEDLLESGTISGQIKNVTKGKSQEGQNVVLVSYMGERQQKRYFAESDSLGRFSFSSLRWDRSYEIMLFHEGIQYVSAKMVFSPAQDQITVDLPVYDTTSSDENISLLSLNVIIYPDDEGSTVNVTSLYVFENSGDTVFTGRKQDSDTTTLVFSIPQEAYDVAFSDGTNPNELVRRGEKFYSQLPFLPGIKRVVLNYSLALSQVKGKFQIDCEYEVRNIAVFIKKTELGIRVKQPEVTADDIVIHNEAFLKYELSGFEPVSIDIVVSSTSLLNSNLGRYLHVIFFLIFVVLGTVYFFYRKNRSSSMN